MQEEELECEFAIMCIPSLFDELISFLGFKQAPRIGSFRDSAVTLTGEAVVVIVINPLHLMMITRCSFSPVN